MMSMLCNSLPVLKIKVRQYPDFIPLTGHYSPVANTRTHVPPHYKLWVQLRRTVNAAGGFNKEQDFTYKCVVRWLQKERWFQELTNGCVLVTH